MFLAIKLSETNQVPTHVQALKVGEFYQEDGKKVKITKEMLKSFVKNFDDKARGYEDGKLPIDYFHENGKHAAGWIEKVVTEADDSELWFDVKWTKPAEQKLSEGEIRYISIEFSFNYQHNEGGKKFGPTLFGAGLTNRPFIKGMDPITMFDENKNKEKNVMTLEQALEKIKELEGKLAKQVEEYAVKEKEMGDVKKQLSEAQTKNEKEKKDAEQQNAFNKLLAEGKVVEAQRAPFIANDMVKFSELAKNTNINGGKGNGGADVEEDTVATKTDAQDEVIELAEKEMKASNCTFSEATKRVLSKDKELNKRYLKEVAV